MSSARPVTAAPDAPPNNAPAHHGNRHGRSEEGRLAILHAADDLLAERGFDGVTMEGIARRAGVAKQTIYRWWKTKTEVLLDAYLQDATEDLEPPDTGALGTDLPDHLRRLAWFLTESDQGAVFRALMARAQLDPDFAREFRTRCLQPQRDRGLLPLTRAVQRGELPADLDAAAESEQLTSPLYYRVLVTGEPVDPDFTDRIARAFLVRHGLPAPDGRAPEAPPAGSRATRRPPPAGGRPGA